MKKQALKYWSERMVDSSKTILSYRESSYRFDLNSMTFVRTDSGKVTGHYKTLKMATEMKGALTDAQILTGMQERATELSTFVPDSLIRSIVDRFSTFENGLRILFSHLYTSKA